MGKYARLNAAVKTGKAVKLFLVETIDTKGRWGYTECDTLSEAKRTADFYRNHGHTNVTIEVTAR